MQCFPMIRVKEPWTNQATLKDENLFKLVLEWAPFSLENSNGKYKTAKTRRGITRGIRNKEGRL